VQEIAHERGSCPTVQPQPAAASRRHPLRADAGPGRGRRVPAEGDV